MRVSRLLLAEPGAIVKAEYARYDGLGEVLRLVAWLRASFFSFAIDMVSSIKDFADADIETRICVEATRFVEGKNLIVLESVPRCVNVKHDGYVEVV